MKNIDEISVFFPTYNEEKNIEKTVTDAEKILEEIANTYEILVIDDGSKDKTSEIVKKLISKNSNIKLISHKKNKGYGASVTSGLYGAKYNIIVFTDADGQFNFSEIYKFIETQKKTNADLVIGYYIKRKVFILRKLNTFIWQYLVRLFFGLNVRDIDCAFKLIKKEVVESIPKLEAQRGAFISTEFLVKAKIKKFKIIEIPVHHYTRVAGASTGANIDVIIGSFKDLFKLRKKIKN